MHFLWFCCGTVSSEKKKCEEQLDNLDSNLVWVDWVSKFTDEIDANIRKKEDRKDFLNGVVDKIVVNTVTGLDRNEKEVQSGHSFDIKFKMNIVDDKIIYEDESNKSLGYELKDGKKTLKTGHIDFVTVKRGTKASKKKAKEV